MTYAIDKSTRINLFAAIAMCCVVFSCGWWIASTISYTNELIASIDARLQVVESEKYTLSMACENALRMALANPGVRVPDPRVPGNLIVSDGVRP